MYIAQLYLTLWTNGGEDDPEYISFTLSTYQGTLISDIVKSEEIKTRHDQNWPVTKNPHFMKLCKNDYLMRGWFLPSSMRIWKKMWIFVIDQFLRVSCFHFLRPYKVFCLLKKESALILQIFYEIWLWLSIVHILYIISRFYFLKKVLYFFV